MRKGNLWGPKPTVGLPLYALATSGIIAFRHLTGPRVKGPETAEPPAEKEATLVA